jgi:hypothetical protein
MMTELKHDSPSPMVADCSTAFEDFFPVVLGHGDIYLRS